MQRKSKIPRLDNRSRPSQRHYETIGTQTSPSLESRQIGNQNKSNRHTLNITYSIEKFDPNDSENNFQSPEFASTPARHLKNNTSSKITSIERAKNLSKDGTLKIGKSSSNISHTSKSILKKTGSTSKSKSMIEEEEEEVDDETETALEPNKMLRFEVSFDESSLKSDHPNEPVLPSTSNINRQKSVLKNQENIDQSSDEDVVESKHAKTSRSIFKNNKSKSAANNLSTTPRPKKPRNNHSYDLSDVNLFKSLGQRLFIESDNSLPKTPQNSVDSSRNNTPKSNKSAESTQLQSTSTSTSISNNDNEYQSLQTKNNAVLPIINETILGHSNQGAGPSRITVSKIIDRSKNKSKNTSDSSGSSHKSIDKTGHVRLTRLDDNISNSNRIIHDDPRSRTVEWERSDQSKSNGQSLNSSDATLQKRKINRIIESSSEDTLKNASDNLDQSELENDLKSDSDGETSSSQEDQESNNEIEVDESLDGSEMEDEGNEDQVPINDQEQNQIDEPIERVVPRPSPRRTRQERNHQILIKKKELLGQIDKEIREKLNPNTKLRRSERLRLKKLKHLQEHRVQLLDEIEDLEDDYEPVHQRPRIDLRFITMRRGNAGYRQQERQVKNFRELGRSTRLSTLREE